MIDFIVGFFAVIFAVMFYIYIGYWFLEWDKLPAEHWISQTADKIKNETERIFSPLRLKTRRDYVLLSKKLWAYMVLFYLKTILFVLKLKKLFFEKNENKNKR
jgi:hypothetical protein